MPQVRKDEVTIGVSELGYIRFDIGKIGGGRKVDLIGVSFTNTTREQGDPRPAYAWKGKASKDSVGTDASDIPIAIGYVCTSGDIVKYFSKEFILLSDDQIGFIFEGENADECEARIIFEVLKDG